MFSSLPLLSRGGLLLLRLAETHLALHRWSFALLNIAYFFSDLCPNKYFRSALPGRLDWSCYLWSVVMGRHGSGQTWKRWMVCRFVYYGSPWWFGISVSIHDVMVDSWRCLFNCLNCNHYHQHLSDQLCHLQSLLHQHWRSPFSWDCRPGCWYFLDG